MTLVEGFSGRIETALKGRALPLLIDADGRACPGASLHTGARVLGDALLAAGYGPGDRIAFRGPKGIDFVHAMLGTLRIGAVFLPHESAEASLVLDEALVRMAYEGELPAPSGGEKESEGGIRFLTSGSTGERKAVTVPLRVLDAQIASHGPLLGLSDGDAIVSYLPWNHAFGGVLELLCGLCAGAEITILGGPFDPEALARAILGADRPWLFTVPKALTALAASPQGPAALARIRGGIVGGAPLDARLCDLLDEFAVPLRVGYGQTECGPGVSLGDPGDFRPGYLGRPVGCAIRLTAEGEIVVMGPNVCLPTGSGERATGDRARPDGDGGYLFEGRCAGGWKWSNGKRFFPETLTLSLPEEVVLLKAPDDAVVIVGIEGEFHPPAWSVRVAGVVAVPFAFREACRTATGKLSSSRTAAVVRRLFPDLAFDPLLYPPEIALEVGPASRLSAADLTRASMDGIVAFDPLALDVVAKTHRFALDKAASDTPIYGWKTGFGPHVEYAAHDEAAVQGDGLILHLQAGQGAALPAEIVRGMLLFRLHTTTQGFSGVSETTVRWLRDALRRDLVPVVPEFGSVGASGDLIPMAHAVAAYRGEGEILLAGVRLPARDALARAGMAPLGLAGRDALALVNGTPLMTSLAAHAVVRNRGQIQTAARLTALLMELVDSPMASLSARLHAVSGHDAHVEIARLIAETADAKPADGRCLQEPYSIRCAPQLLGACLTTLRHVETTVERELNGVADNPLFDVESDAVVHGGAFFGQEIAFAADALSNAIVQAANLVERQLALVLEPTRNGGLPLLLSPDPGRFSGLAGVQLSATATVAEMRRLSMPASIGTLPTNGVNQDVVPFGTHAALNAYRQTERLDLVLGALALALRQAFWLKGTRPASAGTESLLTALEAIPPITRDRALAADVRRAVNLLLADA